MSTLRVFVLSAILSAFGSTIAYGEDFTTLKGEKFTGTISRIEPDGIVIITASGIEKISFLDLREEIRKKHGYDPAAAKKFATQTAAQQNALMQAGQAELVRQEREKNEVHETKVQAEQLEKALKANAVRIKGTVSQVLDEGTLCALDDGSTVFVQGVPGLDAIVDGVPFDITATKIGTYRYETVMGAARTVSRYQYMGAAQ